MLFRSLNLGGFYSQVKDDVFVENHLDTFVTEEDLKQIKKWGFNHLRLPVDYFFFENNGNFDEGRLKRIDAFLHLAEKNGLNTMVDLHKAPGHSFAFKERDKNDIWDRKSENRSRFLNIWDMLSKRYKTRENISFEVMNEPVAPEASMWNELCDDAISVIRNNDKEHAIVVESNLWGSCKMFNELKKFDDDNIIYSFHCYEPILITHQFAPWVSFVIFDIYNKAVEYPGRPQNIGEAYEKVKAADNRFAELLKNNDRHWDMNALEEVMKPVLDFKAKHNVPVYCGEYGCVVRAEPGTRQRWTTDFTGLLKKHSISSAYWSYKNMDFGIVDYTELYKDNPNYDSSRLDAGMLKAVQNAIL